MPILLQRYERREFKLRSSFQKYLWFRGMSAHYELKLWKNSQGLRPYLQRIKRWERVSSMFARRLCFDSWKISKKRQRK